MISSLVNKAERYHIQEFRLLNFLSSKVQWPDLKWFSIFKVKCPIHIGTLNMFNWVIIRKIS